MRPAFALALHLCFCSASIYLGPHFFRARPLGETAAPGVGDLIVLPAFDVFHMCPVGESGTLVLDNLKYVGRRTQLGRPARL